MACLPELKLGPEPPSARNARERVCKCFPTSRSAVELVCNIDRYFRTISGNTQVNATEIRAMNFPELRVLARIGAEVRCNADEAEPIVLRELGEATGPGVVVLEESSTPDGFAPSTLHA